MFVVLSLECLLVRRWSEALKGSLGLGDRPIEITLERAWNSLKWSEKLSLAKVVRSGITSSTDKFDATPSSRMFINAASSRLIVNAARSSKFREP
ncbi:traB domain-containing protein [Artemisia annua]|uniref:TraB domain-containing protein n=1 Tax=Artemisia annua TaxID=35608 RepID=A0A2U1QN58_ARTAN|nr:traB domain-containing protein [Artemisia annua]